jgi:23S rRNA pseudouridine1911/1915/1917 synthase
VKYTAARLDRYEFTVKPEDAGERLDAWLARQGLPWSRSQLSRRIEEGEVTVGGAEVRTPSRKLRAKERVVLTAAPPVAVEDRAEDIPLAVVYEDRHLIVIDKPAGMVVHPATSHQAGTLVNALLHHCGDSLAGVGGERRPGIVHRLDKDTSGIMVVAKTQLANAALTAAFAARDLDRAYLALVWGLPNPLAGDIEGAIGRDTRDRKRMAVVDRNGRAALTHYRTLRAWQTAVALLECRLATGRTHQIRVHLASRGHPVVGDPVYLRRVPAAARSLPQPIRGQLLDFPRQALHATRLAFAHPRTGQRLDFATEPPADMAGLIASLDDDLHAAQG